MGQLHTTSFTGTYSRRYTAAYESGASAAASMEHLTLPPPLFGSSHLLFCSSCLGPLFFYHLTVPFEKTEGRSKDKDGWKRNMVCPSLEANSNTFPLLDCSCSCPLTQKRTSNCGGKEESH